MINLSHVRPVLVSPRQILLVLVVPVLLVGGWWATARWAGISGLVLPSPTRVIETGVDLTVSGELLRHTSASVGRLVLGGVIGTASGLVLGVLAGRNDLIARGVMPLTSFFSGISGIIWIPLAFAWFGTGLGMATFLIWNSVFFIVFANTVQGVRSVPAIYSNAVLTLGGRRRDVIFGAVIPGAMPSIITGVRVGFGFAWRALIAAEILGAPVGLGQMIYRAGAWQRTDIMIAGALFIGVLGTLFDRVLFERIERRTVVRWGTMGRPS